jgi:hypothetical protein
MSKWDKISLYKFQQVEAINSRKDLPDLDKILFSVCAVFDHTEYELDNLPIKKVDKMASEITKIFSTPFEPKAFNRIGKYFINYDISKVTLGQYIELSFFLQQPIQNAHYTLATVSNSIFQKNKASEHRKKAGYFLKQSITKISASLSKIIEKFTEFNKEYSGLFGLDKEVTGDVQEHKFNKRYGWIYSASQVAEYERITLNEAMKLPVRQALNDLAYLKALSNYQAEQLKKQ